MSYNPYLRGALDWLKKNTDKNEKIMSWWDYGTMMELFSERTPTAKVPSKHALKYVPGNSNWVQSGVELESDDKILSIGKVYTTNNSQEAAKIMKEQNAKYLLVPRDFSGKFPSVYELVYGEMRFIDDGQNHAQGYKLDKESITYKALNDKQIYGFKEVYSDDGAVILKLYQ